MPSNLERKGTKKGEERKGRLFCRQIKKKILKVRRKEEKTRREEGESRRFTKCVWPVANGACAEHKDTHECSVHLHGTGMGGPRAAERDGWHGQSLESRVQKGHAQGSGQGHLQNQGPRQGGRAMVWAMQPMQAVESGHGWVWAKTNEPTPEGGAIPLGSG